MRTYNWPIPPVSLSRSNLVDSSIWIPQPCLISTNLDITERERMEEELRFSTAAFKSIHEGIIITDVDSNITYWNEMSEELFGIKASEAIGKDVKEITKPIPRYPGHEKELEEKYRDQGYNRDELIYTTPRGEAWVDTTIRPLKGRRVKAVP